MFLSSFLKFSENNCFLEILKISYDKNQKFHIKFSKIEVFPEKVSYVILTLVLEHPKVSYAEKRPGSSFL